MRPSDSFWSIPTTCAGAVESFRRAQALVPESSEIAYDLGLALRKTGDLAGAEAQLRRALAGPRRRQVPVARWGWCSGRTAISRARRRRSPWRSRTSPDDAQAQQLLGTTLVKLSRVDEGLRALDRAIELDPRLTEARVARAQVLARNGQADLARRDQVGDAAHQRGKRRRRPGDDPD